MQSLVYPLISPLDDPDYPSDDGEPMSDNMLQYRWIVAIKGGIDAVLIDNPNVVVAGNCLWYPVEGDNTIRVAPDAMVIFDRPRGDRGSYIQHREGGIPVHVAFEVLSPGNRPGEMKRKLEFYQRYGVEEYYVLDPDFARHKGYLRQNNKLVPIPNLFGWTSPRLGIRFEMKSTEKKVLRIFGPDGRKFEDYAVIVQQRDASERQAEQERLRADEASLRADEAALRADKERLRADRMRKQLRALGLEPED